MAAPGSTGSHETKLIVIRSFLVQPRDVIRYIPTKNKTRKRQIEKSRIDTV